MRLLADQGDADAQYILGAMYLTGQGVTQNYAEAVKWVRKAAVRLRTCHALGLLDRTNDGLSGMPADGISLPPKKGDFGTSRGAARTLGYINGATGRKGHDPDAHRQVPMTEVKRTAMLRRGNACN
jgi:uncharacterized protein